MDSRAKAWRLFLPRNPLTRLLPALALAFAATGCAGQSSSDPALPEALGMRLAECATPNVTTEALAGPERSLADDNSDEGAINCAAATQAPTTLPATSGAASVDEARATEIDFGALLEKTRWTIVRTEGLGTGQVDNDRSWISFATGDEFGLTWGGGHNGCNGFVSEIKWTEDGYEVPMILTKTEPQIVGVMTSIGCPETSRIHKLFERGRTVDVDLSGDTIVLTERSRQIEGVRVPFEIDE